jgi:ATP-binding cassette, subfamily B, heavy metal transporter
MPRLLAPDQKITNYSTFQLIRDIYKYIRPYRGNFFIGTILKLISDTISLYPTYALASLVTIIGAGNVIAHSKQIWMITILWIGTNLVAEIIEYLARVKIYHIAEKTAIDVEQTSIRHLFRLNIAWHEKENTGNKLKRISNASSGYRRILRLWVDSLIKLLINILGVAIIIYQFDKLIATFLIIFLVIYFVLSKLLLKRVAVASHQVNIAEEEMSGLQFEAVNNIRSVKIMSMINSLTDRLQFYSDKLFEKIKKRVFWFQNRNSGSELIGFIFKGAILLYIINGVLHGNLALGLLVLFNSYFNRIWDSIQMLSNLSEDVLVARYAISRLNRMMAEPVTIDDESEKKPMPTGWQKISLKKVSFAYGDNQVLKNISFDIVRGEKVGIIGLSGAGKSTLYKLLLKEYEDFEGEILIDGIPIQEISKEDYFKHVAVVLQDTEVFNFSLRENIYLAGPGTPNKEVELQKALEIAHVTEFLPKLPDGVDTPIGEKGVRLSGGEKQRLGIARAVFKQPQLLLLDEATSHLDLESEEKIQDSLHKFFRTVTAVVIAHRLTTIKEMDKILVIEDGEIIESGNFAELHSAQGRFYELWEKQRL